MNYTIMDTDIFQFTEDEIRESLESCGIEVNDQTIYEERCNLTTDYAEEFWNNVRKLNDDGGYAVIADLGMWYGRRNAWAVTKTLHQALQKCAEYMEDIKVEETARGKLLVTGYHHDGTNHYEVYKLKQYADRPPVKSNLRNVHLRKLLGWV